MMESVCVLHVSCVTIQPHKILRLTCLLYSNQHKNKLARHNSDVLIDASSEVIPHKSSFSEASITEEHYLGKVVTSSANNRKPSAMMQKKNVFSYFAEKEKEGHWVDDTLTEIFTGFAKVTWNTAGRPKAEGHGLPLLGQSVKRAA